MAAVKSGIYENVLRNTGRRQQAYALNSVSEYFAELSEAYFDENDFEPFTRKELRAFDPLGYAALRQIWSPKQFAVGVFSRLHDRRREPRGVFFARHRKLRFGTEQVTEITGSLKPTWIP